MDNVNADLRAIAESFDARSASYGRNEWHRRSAERLVELSSVRRGSRVLDAGTGTGFAALAAARRVGPEGHVFGVDISAGMLREARAAVARSGLTNVDLIEADASSLPQYGSETFDLVVCATALIYIPVAPALREWHRLLKRGGSVAFSTMEAGSPPPARIFRECARVFGVLLPDPTAPLGSVSACRRALEDSGFQIVDIVREPVAFSGEDLAVAWESNVRSPAHADVHRLNQEELGALHERYLACLAREERERPGGLHRADMLYAIGRR